MERPYVTAINLAQRVAVLSDDTTLPITNLIGPFGSDTEDPGECQMFVFGSDATGWGVGNSADYERARTQ